MENLLYRNLATEECERINEMNPSQYIGSIRVLEKNDFNLEGCLKDFYFIDSSYFDGMLFGKFQIPNCYY